MSAEQASSSGAAVAVELVDVDTDIDPRAVDAAITHYVTMAMAQLGLDVPLTRHAA